MNNKLKVFNIIFSSVEQYQETIEIDKNLSITVIIDKFDSPYKNILFITEREIGVLKGLVGVPTKVFIY